MAPPIAEVRPSYCYRMTPGHIVDGDTLEALVDLGCKTMVRLTIRCLHINAPEMKGPTRLKGEEARTALEMWIDTRKDFIVFTTKPDKQAFDSFRRYLGMIVATNPEGKQEWLHEWMMENGHAVRYRDDGDDPISKIPR